MLIDDVRLACRVTTTTFDNELNRLIGSAKKDLEVAGVVIPDPIDDIVTTAICTYCRMNFGNPDNYEKLKSSYDEQKAQLSMAEGYTDWGDIDG